MSPEHFDPHSSAERSRTGSMLGLALAHARRALDEPAYARVALEAVDYYLSQMVNVDDVPEVN